MESDAGVCEESVSAPAGRVVRFRRAPSAVCDGVAEVALGRLGLHAHGFDEAVVRAHGLPHRPAFADLDVVFFADLANHFRDLCRVIRIINGFAAVCA